VYLDFPAAHHKEGRGVIRLFAYDEGIPGHIYLEARFHPDRPPYTALIVPAGPTPFAEAEKLAHSILAAVRDVRKAQNAPRPTCGQKKERS